MKVQNYKNHTQSDSGWLLALVTWLGLLIWSVSTVSGMVSYVAFSGEDYKMLRQIALPIVLLVLFLAIVLLKIRMYATKLQDRIIRQEVNFRHYIATGKELDPRLTVKQIVALRFAGDAEFVTLCEKAVQQELTNKQIKQLITDWKGDYLRV